MVNFPLLYSLVPRINCMGKCQASCGPINGSPAEKAYFEKQTGKSFPEWQKVIATRHMECPHLDPLGRCEVYANRPIVCRLWGVVPEMPCPWGCTPERMLSSKEGQRLLTQTWC